MEHLIVFLVMTTTLFFFLYRQAIQSAKYWEEECTEIIKTYKPYNDAWKKAYKKLKQQWDEDGVIYDKQGYTFGVERIFIRGK